jgi:hypothetical protein
MRREIESLYKGKLFIKREIEDESAFANTLSSSSFWANVGRF